jgi:uncharacterized radical SAM protein YgiQ
MFLPTTKDEIARLGWDRADIILVTSDAYIDSPHIGIAVIGKYLMHHGFRTAVIAMPSTASDADIARLGEPKLFWGVTGGSIDSMVANYTPTLKKRHQDDYTPGGVNRRPDRATIAYTNLIKRYFKDTVPIVLGGLEASLRRVAHYDYWDNAVRRALLFDAKADILVYGMAEKTILALAGSLRNGTDWKSIPGLCFISSEPVPGFLELPSYDEVKTDRPAYMRMFRSFYQNADDPSTGLIQKHGDRWLIHNPPQAPITTPEFDAVYDLDFERDVHPYYKTGEVRALETIRQSITTHRGCFGQCSFCSITVHQGRTVVSRSKRSVLDEVRRLTRLPGFNGIIYDVGGPTANMYSCVCTKGGAPCKGRNCLMPQPCSKLSLGHTAQIELLNDLMKVPGVKRVFVSSGIRHDLVIADRDIGKRYVEQLVYQSVAENKPKPEPAVPPASMYIRPTPPVRYMPAMPLCSPMRYSTFRSGFRTSR